jgi:hypothetical protein
MVCVMQLACSLLKPRTCYNHMTLIHCTNILSIYLLTRLSKNLPTYFRYLVEQFLPKQLGYNYIVMFVQNKRLGSHQTLICMQYTMYMNWKANNLSLEPNWMKEGLYIIHWSYLNYVWSLKCLSLFGKKLDPESQENYCMFASIFF